MNSCFSSPLISYQSTSTDSIAGASQLVIRTAQVKDLKGLAEVLTNSFHPPQGLLYWMYPLLKLGIYEDLRNRLHSCSPHYMCLVASKPVTTIVGEGEEIVGTVEIALRSTCSWPTICSQYPYISNLAVRNSARRQGIARKLLLKCEQVALDWGFQQLYLHVLENNYQARQLYFTSGYQLHRIESSLSGWLFKRPRRLLLNKHTLKPMAQATGTVK
ncbi:MAG: GNAT family N-acetyltransferase [Xenococcaceae cyanobacterium]